MRLVQVIVRCQTVSSRGLALGVTEAHVEACFWRRGTNPLAHESQVACTLLVPFVLPSIICKRVRISASKTLVCFYFIFLHHHRILYSVGTNRGWPLYSGFRASCGGLCRSGRVQGRGGGQVWSTALKPVPEAMTQNQFVRFSPLLGSQAAPINIRFHRRKVIPWFLTRDGRDEVPRTPVLDRIYCRCQHKRV